MVNNRVYRYCQWQNSLQFIDNGEMIVSSSLDASLRLWRVRGQFIGIFDRKIPWSYAKQTPAATWWPNLRIGGVPVPKIRHKADTLKKPGQEPKRRSSRKPSQDLEAAERKKREVRWTLHKGSASVASNVSFVVLCLVYKCNSMFSLLLTVTKNSSTP